MTPQAKTCVSVSVPDLGLLKMCLCHVEVAELAQDYRYPGGFTYILEVSHKILTHTVV